MRICLVGHHVHHPDEGVRKVTYHLARELARKHDVFELGISDLKGWAGARAFRPDIIHYVVSPTLGGLAAARLLSLTCKAARTVISAPHPDLSSLGRLASLFRPDVMLVQAEDSERVFRSLGYRTQFLPNGVDVERFMPASGATKERLRNKYSIKNDRFVILHVGSLKRGRNLQHLQTLQGNDNQVLILGRPSQRQDLQLTDQLGQQGCTIWSHYIPRVEEIYALSDCYIFPTTHRRCCIEMPLSVLEAMSCNLPVITTKFGALPRAFREGEGLVFVDSEDDLTQELYRMKGASEVRTRDKVLPYSWPSVLQKLDGIYERLVAE